MAPAPMVAPAAVMAKRAGIVRRFDKAAAHSPETARSLDDLSITRGLIVRRMIKGGVIREEPGGRFWLDEAANAAFYRGARRGVAIAVGVMAVVIAVVLLVR